MDINISSKDSSPCIPPEKNMLLISEVKKFTSLYDTSDPNYYVLAERNKAWLQVAQNCNEPAELCHLRWKSLRKRYAKERKRFHEILQGLRRPWALFPKMSFLTPTTSMRRIKPSKPRRKIGPASFIKTNREGPTSISSDSSKQNGSDDDMLIINDKDEVVSTCKSTEISEDEYIYETLDDPDSALEIMKSKPLPKVKPTAIRSGASLTVPATPRFRGSGRIRKVTPKMQNSFIAKKLKQAQQILQESNVSSNDTDKKPPPLQKASIENPNKSTEAKKYIAEKAVLYQDNTTRHVATVNPNIIRVEKITDKKLSPPEVPDSIITLSSKRTPDKNNDVRPFKVIKLKGKNPIIFSPEQLPNIQSFLKAEASSAFSVSIPDQNGVKKPLIKVKSVDNLNKQNEMSSSMNDNNENNNLDIIHSVGLVRRNTVEKCAEKNESSLLRDSLIEAPSKKISHQSYSRSYSWNRPRVKTANKQTTTEKIQPDSQTNDYEIEETWNDIKQENIEDNISWNPDSEMEQFRQQEQMVTFPESPNKQNMWNKVNEAKLELVAFQKKLLEEQHKKTMEYLKKEHDLKMTLLKAEIDLKRKQLNIML